MSPVIEPAARNLSTPSAQPSDRIAQSSTPTPPALVQKTPAELAAELAAEHAHFLARYLNPLPTRTQGAKSIALVVASDNGELNVSFATTLATLLATDGVSISPTVFKPQFVSDGLFVDILGGSRSAIEKLELEKALDGLVLVRETVEYAVSPSLQNLITATMKLEITSMSVGVPSGRKTRAFTSNGPGFKEVDARHSAEERLIKQITAENNILQSAFR